MIAQRFEPMQKVEAVAECFDVEDFDRQYRAGAPGELTGVCSEVPTSLPTLEQIL